jgi:hypothetical protein
MIDGFDLTSYVPADTYTACEEDRSEALLEPLGGG